MFGIDDFEFQRTVRAYCEYRSSAIGSEWIEPTEH